MKLVEAPAMRNHIVFPLLYSIAGYCLDSTGQCHVKASEVLTPVGVSGTSGTKLSVCELVLERFLADVKSHAAYLRRGSHDVIRSLLYDVLSPPRDVGREGLSGIPLGKVT